MSTIVSPPDDLDAFVRAAKERGVADEFLVALLRQNGWSERRVYRSFGAYYADVLGRPVPTRSGRAEHARDAFAYVLNFLALGSWTVALGQIFYALIDRWLPDAARSAYAYGSLRDEVSGQLATVLVAFPVFLAVHRWIGGQLRRRIDLYESGVRRWLTYGALVVAANLLLLDGIWFVEAFLRGELTLSFFARTLVLLALGGGVFAYYVSTIDPPRAER